MGDVNFNGSLSREQLIKILDKINTPQSEKNRILLLFDNADAITNKNNILEGDEEIGAFHKAMGWEQRKTEPQQAQIMQQEEQQKTGGIYAEYDEKTGGSTVYNKNKNTITKYDKNNKIISITDMEGNPIVTPKDTPNIPEDKKLSEQDIKEKALSLKAGEQWSYEETISSNWGSGYSIKSRPVTWQRNSDGTLSRLHMDEIADRFNNRRNTKIKTMDTFEIKYSSDLKTKIFEDSITKTSHQLKAKARTFYNQQGNPEKDVIELENFNNSQSSSMAFTKEGQLLRIMKSPKFTSQEIRDKDGNIILRFENGEYKNTKGKSVSDDKAYSILEQAIKNNSLHELVQNH